MPEVPSDHPLRLPLAGGSTAVVRIGDQARVNSEGGAIAVPAVDEVTIKGAGIVSSEMIGTLV
ncbi:MAG: hypothetical protein VYD62_02720 [Candidatus Thermoplasmatota archaeon]|nr:hypothetical protein [Arenicellales bacterium]MEC7713650.1 hypothetical protein [Candidatus Thermoplasmatota archaeon]MED5159112.1 hypothetical protein [Candidatus Thermoplasmatota archaeon]MEE3231936.1 hypothetical protein [Candidatus Thermoplasmatota archaeon]